MSNPIPGVQGGQVAGLQGQQPAQQAQQAPVTPPAEGSTQSGAPQTPQDVGSTAQLDELRQRYERDLSNLRSTLDRRYNQSQQQWEQERTRLMSRLDQVVTANMDDAAREAYEFDRLQEEHATMQQTLQQARQEAEASRSMMEYAKWFNQLGVPFEKMEFESPETLMQSAWTGLKDQINTMKQEIDRLKTQAPQTPVQPTGQNPAAPQTAAQTPAPQTFTGHGSPPSTGDVLTTVQNALKNQYGREVSLDETFAAIESGQVDINALLRAGGG